MKSRAWAPGHSTLFFSVPYRGDIPQERGSLGGGFNFSSGVETTLSITDHDQVLWNGKAISGEVSLSVIDRFREMGATVSGVSIEHRSELEIGFGLSTSGAGALGVALAINEQLENMFTIEECYQTAHYADVINHTGLGSVMGQITGGIELRTKIGGPGVGHVKHIPGDEMIIILMHSSLKTSEVLQSEEQMKKVTESGLKKVDLANSVEADHITQFLRIGRRFTEECGLQTQGVGAFLSRLDEINEDRSTMAMIGETIIVYPRDPAQVVEFARKYNLRCIVTSISNQRPFTIPQS
ncbi:MAG: pantoate kinase [Candidatus Kariarchaeaceae archaeon]